VGLLARSFPGGLRDPAFHALVSRIDGGGMLWAGNRCHLYTDGEEATAAMLGAIAGARQEVLLESYIFERDATGRRFLEAAAAAAARGLRVHVLADAVGSFTTPSQFWGPLVQAGGEALFFHRLLPFHWYHLLRDHRKMLVVDRQVVFTGGMNIADEYSKFSARRRRLPPGVMRDTQVRIEGPAAWDFVPVFAEGWERAGGTPLPMSPQPPNEGEGARVLVLDSRPRRGHRETAAVLAALVAAARDSFWITNAYFAPGRTLVAILGHAASRGLDVRLLLPGRTDAPIVRHAGHGWYSRLLDKGVRIFEYQRAVLHAKTVVADRHVSVIGSSNLDFRSFRFNAEINALIFDDGIGCQLADAFERDMVESEEIGREAWRRRGTLDRLTDRAAGILTPFL
jgi:cardiolipin synthase